MTITRKDYLEHRATHREYWGQFLNLGIIESVRACIGADRIARSTDEHFNDIPLALWDSLSYSIRTSLDKERWREANGWKKAHSFPWSASDSVCIAKEAARQIKEELEGECT